MTDSVKSEKKFEQKILHKTGEGLNLIAPQLQKAQVETQKKFEIDIRVVLFVFFVVLISLGIVGYSWYVNTTLAQEEIILEELERELEGYQYTIEANNQILERYKIYERVQEGFISSKEVLNFWQEVSENLGEIRKIELTNGTNFEISGQAKTLRDVTKLWHFLSIDDRISSVTLEGLSIPSAGGDDTQTVSFSFKGVLNLEYFNKKE